MSDEKKHNRMYLRVRQTSRRNAIGVINGLLIESKSPLRVSEDNFVASEAIPYDGVSAFREYMYTLMIEADPEKNADAADMLRKAGIGVSAQAEREISVLIDIISDPVARQITAALEGYGLGRNVASEATEEILGMLIGRHAFGPACRRGKKEESQPCG